MQDFSLFLSHHLELSIALGVAIFCLAIVEFLRAKRAVGHITPQQATQLINHQHAIVIDIRPKETFATGHIIEALSMPEIATKEGIKKLEKFYKKPIIVVCASGQESQKIAAQLKNTGYHVYTLRGGIRGWREANMPLVT